MEIRNRRAMVSGMAFLGFALIYLFFAWSYDPGTAARMGPGYFPRMLGILLAILGVMIMAGSVRRSASVEHVERWDFRALAWVLGSVLLFALLLPTAGFVVALVALLMVSSLASHEFTWTGALLSTAVLTAFAVLAFYYGIGLQLQLLPAIF